MICLTFQSLLDYPLSHDLTQPVLHIRVLVHHHHVSIRRYVHLVCGIRVVVLQFEPELLLQVLALVADAELPFESHVVVLPDDPPPAFLLGVLVVVHLGEGQPE